MHIFFLDLFLFFILILGNCQSPCLQYHDVFNRIRHIVTCIVSPDSCQYTTLISIVPFSPCHRLHCFDCRPTPCWWRRWTSRRSRRLISPTLALWKHCGQIQASRRPTTAAESTSSPIPLNSEYTHTWLICLMRAHEEVNWFSRRSRCPRDRGGAWERVESALELHGVVWNNVYEWEGDWRTTRATRWLMSCL